MPPSQKMPYTLLNMLVHTRYALPRIPQSEVLLPASPFLIQPVAHFFPWCRVAGLRCSLTLSLIRSCFSSTDCAHMPVPFRRL